MKKHYRQAPRKQAGFIQNFIIPGIILIGVVIAGLAWLSSGSSTNTSNEKASMLANVVMAQSLTVTAAIQRAEADGAIPATTVSTVVDTNASLVVPKYIATGSMPQLPADLGNGAWSYTQNAFAAKAAGADIGSASADDVLQVTLGSDDNAKAACLRINNKLYSSSTLAAHITSVGALTSGGTADATTGGVEGCATSGANYVYYKVVNVK